MNNKKYYEIVREEFEKELASKIGWGRNEILAAFDRATSKAAMRFIDEIGRQQAS